MVTSDPTLRVVNASNTASCDVDTFKTNRKVLVFQVSTSITFQIENSFLLGPIHLIKLLSFFYPTNVNWQLDQTKKNTELRSHDRNCVRIFVFHQAVSSFSLQGDPHDVRTYTHTETNENSLDLITIVQIEKSFLSGSFHLIKLLSFFYPTKCELTAGSDKKKKTAQPRRESNLGLPIAGRTL